LKSQLATEIKKEQKIISDFELLESLRDWFIKFIDWIDYLN
jgi:hypothetical protein